MYYYHYHHHHHHHHYYYYYYYYYYYAFGVSVCSLSYPACKAHVPYYTVVCGVPCCNTFFHVIS
jgi:hypothetical protein